MPNMNPLWGLTAIASMFLTAFLPSGPASAGKDAPSGRVPAGGFTVAQRIDPEGALFSDGAPMDIVPRGRTGSGRFFTATDAVVASGRFGSASNPDPFATLNIPADIRQNATGRAEEYPFYKDQPPNDIWLLLSEPIILNWNILFPGEIHRYCIDTINNNSCDQPSWTVVGTDNWVLVDPLSPGTYYWQVCAEYNFWPNTFNFCADNDTWWRFNVFLPEPGAFSKTAPADGAYAAADPTISWSSSEYAEAYTYCVDTTDDNICNGSWSSISGATSFTLSGLTDNTTYYWQVLAWNSSANTYADGGAWRHFHYRTQNFADVSPDYWAWEYIERLYAAGITGGCASSPLRYCPASPVTRAQMAIFLERDINGASYTPPAATGTVFADVPISYWAAAWIEKLAADGITGGCGGGNYCPDQAVTRAEMAIFLLRTKHGSSYTPPAATGTVFGDVPISHWAGAWIEQLSAEGITGGCGGGNYCPNQAVTRAEMAVFIVRTFGLP